MVNWDTVVKSARECHTKQAWEGLLLPISHELASMNTSKPISELFRLLANDPQSLHYDPLIWSSLIRGCISCWNLDLGRQLSDFARKLNSPEVAIPAAQIYLESGSLTPARELANRTLRLSGLQPRQTLQLEMLICTSFAEEGKHAKAIGMLNKMAPHVRSFELNEADRADFLVRMGRMQFFLGRYEQAGELFHETSTVYLRIEDWEAAAKALFNAAACYHNSGGKKQHDALPFIEECQKIALAHNLSGPLAHCESFHGVNAYQNGDFDVAIGHFRKAISYSPTTDKSFRRLHILSMLALTYLATGRYHMARKVGSQTLELAAFDESERFKTRYIELDAELKWESGEIEESQKLLAATVDGLQVQGVLVLEQLSTVNRFLMQSALLGEQRIPQKLKMEESLRKNIPLNLEHQCALGHIVLNSQSIDEAEEIFLRVVNKARQFNIRFAEARGLSGLFQARLAKDVPLPQLGATFKEFESCVSKMGELPITSEVRFAQAGIAYRSGDFRTCERILRDSLKGTRVSFPDRFVAECWLDTMEGRSCRINFPWQQRLLARATRAFFRPTLEMIDEKRFSISGQYIVNLDRHGALAELLQFLMSRHEFSATPAEIQREVWKQSLEVQGWHKKIRNTVMRLRDLLPWSMAPILLQTAGELRLFHEAVEIRLSRKNNVSPEEELLLFLRTGALSSSALAEKMKISSATAKRLLKRACEEGTVVSQKVGRNVDYLLTGGQNRS